MTTANHAATDVLDRMVNAVEQVKRRLLLTANTLKAAGVPYAVVGGNAVAAWVATVDQGAVRNTQDVDVLIRRADFCAARAALEAAGFTYRHAGGLDLFLDAPTASPRSAVHVVFASEVVKPGEPMPNPDVNDATDLGAFRVLNLAALVQIKLTAFRDKHRTHLRDLIEVGLMSGDWITALPAPLASRLQSLLDTPGG